MTDHEKLTDSITTDHGTQKSNDLQSFAEAVAERDQSLVGETQMTWLSPLLIEEEEGFNERDYNLPHTIAHIEMLAKAWAQSAQMKPIEVQVVDGRCFVRDGHCRLRGAHLAISRGAMIKRIPVIELKGNNQLASVRILTSNEQLKLTIMQRARIYQRLRSWNWDDHQIAEHIGRTSTHVRETLRLLSLPAQIQTLLEQDVIKPHLALDLYRKYGDESVEIIMSSYRKRQEEIEGADPLQLAVEQSSNAGNLQQQAPTQANNEASESLLGGQNETHVAPAKPRQQVKLTSKNIAVPTRRIGKKLVTNMTSSMTGISQIMRKTAVIDAKGGTVAVAIPVELYEQFLLVSDEAARHRKEEPNSLAGDQKKQENLSLAS
ncbi:ParB/RepB/Spo0J family partition protein [Pseudomonas fluorescens]|uniref:ParB/RepB/Spo0J family partition protein n=1 Tax=Pseudomonas fluorescens TaxID=294 RepID=UPI0010E182B2|nr:hypothetical protein [Pseudomonas fluorescens]TCV62806.1 ParB family chromosome partitioning protein [Pseudomonas fluorescens]